MEISLIYSLDSRPSFGNFLFNHIITIYYIKYLVLSVFHHKPIWLTVISIFLNLNLNEKSSCLSQWRSPQKVVLLNINLRTPWRRHIQRLSQILQLLLLIRNLIQLNIKSISYPIIFKLMNFLIPSVPKQLIMQHHILPSNSLIQLKLYLVYLMFWLHVDKKVCVVEYCVH